MDSFWDNIFRWGIKATLFGLLFLFFPKRKSKYTATKPLDELRREFKWFNLFSGLAFFAIAVVICFICQFIFQQISKITLPKFNGALLVISPSYWDWLGAGIFLSFGLTVAIFSPLAKLYLKDRYSDYMAYNTMSSRFDSEKLLRFIVPFLLVGAFIIVLAVSDSYTAVFRDKIIVDYYLSFQQKEYSYQDITKVKEFTDKKGKYYFHITFNDGKVWSSRQNGNNDYNTDSQILDIIEEVRDDVVWE